MKQQISALLRDPNTAFSDEKSSIRSPRSPIEEISLNLFGERYQQGESKEDKTIPVSDSRGSNIYSTAAWQPITLPSISPNKEYKGIREEIKEKEAGEDLLKNRLSKLRELHRDGLKVYRSFLKFFFQVEHFFSCRNCKTHFRTKKPEH